MLYQITDGTVTLGGNTVLSHIDFEIRGCEKIAVVGRNGVGKTTLLRLIAGEIGLDRDDKRFGAGITCARKLTVGMLGQQGFKDSAKTVEEELLEACPGEDIFARERFSYEQEYDSLFTGFGFAKEDKKKRLRDFSGGEQTKIALIRLLLSKPDILLLDEPTNHLDIETCQWLEEYMRNYGQAVVMVSHDRYFLDQTADVVWELARGRLTRYPGSYTHYREEKLKAIRLQTKAYERQQEEIARLEELVERFKHKPTKASFARSKKKAMERMVRVPKPEEDDVHIFTGDITPLFPGSKWVLDAQHLKIGYEKPILELTLRVRRGQKIGILGANGAGKSTFLKTIAGLIPPVSGTYRLGEGITIGYFDQLSAAVRSEKTVAEHFQDLFPAMTEKEVRSVLGAYLFGGRAAGARVNALSGGEKARLILAELLQSRPNLLILDEPTNHMDIQAKETLESAFRAYRGTILFVSHDRYFIRQVAESVLIFENQSVMYYPFGYDHYLERVRREEQGLGIPAQLRAEEQALIAGLKAVPRPERHRLREIPTEEAYADWKLRLALERLQTAERQVEELDSCRRRLRGEWMESEGFWLGQAAPEEYETLLARYEKAWEEWQERCMDWYEEAWERSAPRVTLPQPSA